MTKIGQLYLQEGIWNGNRIISEEWVRESAKKSMDLPAYMRVPYHAYGHDYQWWLETYQSGSGTIYAYSARGWRNQFIVVLKQLNMVVVFIGGAYEINSSIILIKV
jgi:CubicO group peptidase (beta-lactamase class C family)